MLSYHYAYLELSLIFLVIWIIFFLWRKDLRKEILFVSLVIAVMGPLNEILFYFNDYWRPDIFTRCYMGVEDLIYAFAIGGIGATIYYVIFNKKYSRPKYTGYPFYLSLFFMAGLPLELFVNKVVGVNSIYVTCSFLVLITMIMLFLRKDLWWNALASAILFTLLFAVIYIFWIYLYPNVFTDWWMTKNVSGVSIFRVPIEEYLWAFCWGLSSGIFYKFIRGVAAE